MGANSHGDGCVETWTNGITKPDDPKRVIATEFEIRGAISELRAVLTDGSPVHPNTWVFYSNKNRDLLTIVGDVAFVQCVLLEGDPSVTSYSVEDQARHRGFMGTRILARRADDSETFFCRREAFEVTMGSSDLPPNSLSIQSDDKKFETVITDENVRPRLIEFNNWLYLSGAITRSRNFSTAREMQDLFNLLQSESFVTLERALGLSSIDPALMLAAIAKSLAGGLLTCDLENEPINTNKEIYLAKASQKAALKNKVNPIRSSSLSSIPHNRRTNRYSELFEAPWRWFPPVQAMPSIHPEFVRRIKAVQAYIYNRPFEEIIADTGFSKGDIRKKFYRTLNHDSDGKPLGILALKPYFQIKHYTRKSPLPASNIALGAKGGYAGAFAALLRKFPDDLLAPIEAAVLKQRQHLVETLYEARVSWTDLHSLFKSILMKLGVSCNEYPFNVRNCASRSLVAFCNALLFKHPGRWIVARGGKNALMRSSIGYGYQPLIVANSINHIKQLDFQKEDSAATVKIKRPKGLPLDVPVPRWWCGLVVDEYSHSIDSSSDAFEQQETEECVMELVDNAISPPLPIEGLNKLTGAKDNNWLPNQIIEGYAWEGWDILRMDRAWAHKSITAVSAIASTIGCAICYGASRVWYARYLIEDTNQKLTQSGPQKLASTYGTGPSDRRRDNPVEHAISDGISQDDICSLLKAGVRWINETSDEGVFFTKPIDILKNAIKKGECQFLPRPLPLPFHDDRPLMWRNIARSIQGNPHDGIAPFVRYCRCRFKGKKLGSAWRHIGQPVYLQLYWRDFRRGRVILRRTNEILDYVVPENKWRSMPLSIRDFEIIQNFGRIYRLHDRSSSPVKQFINEKQSEIISKSSSKKGRVANNRDANVVNRIRRNAKKTFDLTPRTKETPPKIRMRVEQDIYGALGPPPPIGGLTRGKRKP